MDYEVHHLWLSIHFWVDHFSIRKLQNFLQQIFWIFFLLSFSRKKVVRRVRRLNPLTNTKAMLKLNPYAAVLKRQAILSAQKRKIARDAELAEKRGVSVHLCSAILFLNSGLTKSRKTLNFRSRSFNTFLNMAPFKLKFL